MTETACISLTNCTLDQLQSLVNPALDSPDLDAFLAVIPLHYEAAETEEAEQSADDGTDDPSID